MCEHALRGQVAFWKVPRVCCGTSTRIRIDWAGLASRLLLKLLDILGHASATARAANATSPKKACAEKIKTGGRRSEPQPLPRRFRAHSGFGDFCDRRGLNSPGSGPDVRSGLSGLSACLLPGLQQYP